MTFHVSQEDNVSDDGSSPGGDGKTTPGSTGGKSRLRRIRQAGVDGVKTTVGGVKSVGKGAVKGTLKVMRDPIGGSASLVRSAVGNTAALVSKSTLVMSGVKLPMSSVKPRLREEIERMRWEVRIPLRPPLAPKPAATPSTACGGRVW